MRFWVSVIFLISSTGCGDDTVSAGRDVGVTDLDVMTDAVDMAVDVGSEKPGCANGPTWSNFADGFVRNYCRGCHGGKLVGQDRNGAPASFEIDTYDSVVRQLVQIEGRALRNPTMPPGGGPSEEELRDFKRWIDCETPN